MNDITSIDGKYVCTADSSSEWAATCILGEVVKFAQQRTDRPMWEFWIWDVRRIGAELERRNWAQLRPTTLLFAFTQHSLILEDGVSWGGEYPWRVVVWCDSTDMLRIRIVEEGAE